MLTHFEVFSLLYLKVTLQLYNKEAKMNADAIIAIINLIAAIINLLSMLI